ncbi:hypothetical protein E6Q11_00635 [Candidatus Dojkabacteria bacterium]|uniref:Uncharacterized protein n=1 Tax=Candidatus Dojkabacteria bacterium TaxID=2099670 RepID=A0A5C7JDM5_9BACT|nr:MAG: hypothetical protein E6Q11_00635 [Candidatus Dojkabacteria bacterium]
MYKERPNSDPKTPRALERAVRSFEKRFDEWVPMEAKVATQEEYQETVNYVFGKVAPILEALSYPEIYSTSTTVTYYGVGMTEPVRSKDRIRRIAEFSPRAKFEGNDYGIGVLAITDFEGNYTHVQFHTGKGPETISVAALTSDGSEGRNIVWLNRRQATAEQLEEVRELADFVEAEAIKQAVAAYAISPNWFARQQKDWVPEEGMQPEDFPVGWDYYGGEYNLYELIQANGERIVGKVVKDRNKLKWVDDVETEIDIDASGVVAWRRMGKVNSPDYYTKRKYPSLYAMRQEMWAAYFAKKLRFQSDLVQ